MKCPKCKWWHIIKVSEDREPTKYGPVGDPVRWSTYKCPRCKSQTRTVDEQ